MLQAFNMFHNQDALALAARSNNSQTTPAVEQVGGCQLHWIHSRLLVLTATESKISAVQQQQQQRMQDCFACGRRLTVRLSPAQYVF